MNDNRKYGIHVVIAAFMAYFVFFGYRSSFSVLLTPMTTDMGWDVARVTLGYSIMMIIYAITSYFSGVIFNKFGPKFCFGIATVTAFLGYFVTSRAHNYFAYLIPYTIFAGVATAMLFVPATSSVRSWHVGSAYGRAFGFAQSGACVAQVILTLGLKAALLTMDWRFAMTMLAFVSAGLLLVATIVTKKPPKTYGMEPVGEIVAPAGGAPAPQALWTVKEAFSTYALWGTIACFFCACFSEFLIWSQLVSYWVKDVELSMSTSTNLYAFIGFLGIIFAPTLGAFSDRYAQKLGDEAAARRNLMIIAPSVGIVAMLFLINGESGLALSIIAAVLFPVYWMMMPAQVTGYIGAIFGRASFPQIWGLATLIIMGIGPAAGSYLGAKLYVIYGSYRISFIMATVMFLLSALFALSLPRKFEQKAQGSPGV